MVGAWRRCLKTCLLRGRHLSICGASALLAVLAGCSANPAHIEDWVVHQNSALSDVYSVGSIPVDGWTIVAMRKHKGPARRIYIEGDGHAYISRDTPSGDPTPVNPVGLKLALADGGESVEYMARPCQWERGPECADRTLWTEGRFTQAVVDRYVKLVAQESAGGPVELVGYSGGAWVALQVAARLDNVTRVVTVAGNLMPDWVNAQHKVTRIEVAAYPDGRLKNLPVVAYVGKGDTVVGRGVVEAYRTAVGAENIRVIEMEATHADGWSGLKIP